MSPLRRTGDLSRYTELRSYTPLSRTGDLSRTTPMRRVRTQEEVRASRPTVTAEERLARAVVRLRAAGLCEGCGRAPATDYAHRVGRAQGGPWCPANALALDRACHEWSHSFPVEARSVGWLLRSHDNYLTFPVLLPAHGLVLLGTDGTYIPAERTAA